MYVIMIMYMYDMFDILNIYTAPLSSIYTHCSVSSEGGTSMLRYSLC